ncbi:transcriptional regulator with XRE-family HTH domain [Salirhabdus euzebyi]|uniref:Transcriptional regulator with XRE-family HTH domain n=1 Tax=Salirhabdus euzebyi TaxID=394506 RepID=A0A841PX73_9BACI|nr:helix-turn-helix domain-containing protein [Salirhabdus euzebyi]MBB6452006.1 transcriptional regulator with XRE-family HTH domain [Salirhabdus euzebyi]
MEYDKRCVATRIKMIRKEKGLTLEEFGKIADGAGKSNVSRWERGLALPSNKRLKIISELGGITVNALLFGIPKELPMQNTGEMTEQIPVYQANSINHLTKILNDIHRERIRQNQKWGIQRHDWGKWLGILGEEYGEVCQAINRIYFPSDAKPTDAVNLYNELIQLSAVAASMAEQIKEEEQ